MVNSYDNELNHFDGGKVIAGVIKCRAAVAWAARETLAIEEVELSPPGPLEIRIKVVSTSLCRRDFTSWLSEAQPQLFPRIFGHEASGNLAKKSKL